MEFIMTLLGRVQEHICKCKDSLIKGSIGKSTQELSSKHSHLIAAISQSSIEKLFILIREIRRKKRKKLITSICILFLPDSYQPFVRLIWLAGTNLLQCGNTL